MRIHGIHETESAPNPCYIPVCCYIPSWLLQKSGSCPSTKTGNPPDVWTAPWDNTDTQDCSKRAQVSVSNGNLSTISRLHPPEKAKKERQRESMFASGARFENVEPCSKPFCFPGTIQRSYCISTSSGWKSSGLFSGKKKGPSGSFFFVTHGALPPFGAT